ELIHAQLRLRPDRTGRENNREKEAQRLHCVGVVGSVETGAGVEGYVRFQNDGFFSLAGADFACSAFTGCAFTGSAFAGSGLVCSGFTFATGGAFSGFVSTTAFSTLVFSTGAFATTAFSGLGF